MERRKFLLGAGSAAVGASAVIGSGAFTSVNADRTVSVNVAGDASAYLGIESMNTPNGNTYVDESGDAVQITLDGTDNSDGSNLGSGINANAETKFADLLQITNQGTQEINVGVDDNNGPIVASDGSSIDGGVFLGELVDLDGDEDTQPNGGFAIPDSPVAMRPGDVVDQIGLDINDPSTIPSGDDDATITIIALSNSEFDNEFTSTPPAYD